MPLPSSLEECAERLELAQDAVAKTQGVVRLVGAVALVFGVGWAVWEVVHGRKKATEEPAAEAEPETTT